MKLISNEEYTELVTLRKNKSDEKFYKDLCDMRYHEMKDLEAKNTKEVNNLKEDHKIELERMECQIDIKVSKATESAKKEITRLTIDNGSLKKENEMLTKAFENLGFDVKDMKEMFDKLVDGIVGKNQVQVIKS